MPSYTSARITERGTGAQIWISAVATLSSPFFSATENTWLCRLDWDAVTNTNSVYQKAISLDAFGKYGDGALKAYNYVEDVLYGAGSGVHNTDYRQYILYEDRQSVAHFSLRLYGRSGSPYAPAFVDQSGRTGSWDAPLAEIYIPITVPLLPVAPKPTLTTSGSHNSPTNNVRINGVAPGGGYIYHLGTQVGSGAWKWENANAGAIVTKPQVANNKVRYRARCQTVGSTSWTYSDPTGYFYGHASAPTGLSASYSGGAVKLAWNLNTFEPSRVDVGRSSNPDMSGGRIIYSGKAISTFEDNSPPAGNVYYRVATYPAYSTSAAAGVTGIAAAQTMTPPAPISNVINNGNISFSWTNNSNPTISPYAFLRVYSSAGGHDDVTGDTTVYYPDIPDASDAYFEVVAHNGAGVSTPARAGYFSGEPETPNLTIDDATGKDISILVSPSPDSYDSGRAINRTTIVYLSDSNVLVEIGRVSGGGGVITYEAPTDGLYRFSAETVVSFDDFGYEMSSGMSSEIVANIEFAPKSVLSIAYDDASNLITVSLPEDYAGRELNVSVDGNIVGTYTVGGDAQSIDTAFTPFKPHFVISANITNNYSDDTTVTKSQAVILGDYIPVIGGSKYLVKIIDSSGSRYAKVKLI